MSELPVNDARLLAMRALWLDWKLGGWRGVERIHVFHSGVPLAEIELLVEAGLARKKGSRLLITPDGVAWIETHDKEYCHA